MPRKKAANKNKEQKQVIKQQNAKFNNILQIKSAIEEAYYAKYHKVETFGRQEINKIHSMLILQPNLSIDNEFNEVIGIYSVNAIKHGFLNVIQSIINHKLDNDIPLLNVAVSYGRNEIVRWLMPHVQLTAQSKGNVIDADNIQIAHDGYTAIHEAARVGNEEALTILYTKDKRVLKITNNIGLTAFHVALQCNRLDIAKAMLNLDQQIIDTPINVPANPNFPPEVYEYSGSTALYLASDYGLVDDGSIGRKGNEKIVDFLIDHGANINKPTPNGRVPLYVAVWGKHYTVVEKLLSAGAKVDFIPGSGMSPLFLAVSKGDQVAVQLFIDHGKIGINSDYLGYILDNAIYSCQRTIFELLLTNYPDGKIGTAGFSSLLEKIKGQDIEFFHSKLTNPKHLENFKYAVLLTIIGKRNSENFSDILEFFIHTPIISQILKDNNYFLDEAILKNDTKLFAQLVSAGGKVKIFYSTTTLLGALDQLGEDFVKDLICKYNLDINSLDCNGSTLAHIAASYGMSNILEFLLNRGALPNEENDIGLTPLYYAKYHGHKECIKLLEMALGIVPLAEVAPPDVVLGAQNESEEDNGDEEYTPPTQAEEARALSIEQQIHRIYQEHKARLNNLPEFQEAVAQSWVIKSANGNPGEIYSESIKHSGEVFKVAGHAGKVTYLAISDNLGLERELLDKFKTAIETGFIGPYGKSGIKTFRKKISQHESVETLYELKIYSSQYGDQRLYTQEKYINANGSELIVFKTLGNHIKVMLVGRESNGIKSYFVDNAVELIDHEPIRSGKVDENIGHFLGQHLGDVEGHELKCAGDNGDEV
jgi:ankyrin repeat protein